MTNEIENSHSLDQIISDTKRLEVLDQVDILTCQQMTNYLDQDLKLNALDNILLNGSLGDDDE